MPQAKKRIKKSSADVDQTKTYFFSEDFLEARDRVGILVLEGELGDGEVLFSSPQRPFAVLRNIDAKNRI